jgi:hypothetical protein
MEVEFDIRRERDHYVVFVNGKFFCSADSIMEAMNELESEGYIV